MRVEVPRALGGWSCEPHDTKLVRSAKAGALIQVCVYAERVAAVQQRMPDRVHVVLGGWPPRRESFSVAQLAAYVRRARGDLLAGEADPTPAFPPSVGYPEPVEHCDVCDWWTTCDSHPRADDHLSLVAGISARQRRSLGERRVDRVAALAGLSLPVVPPLGRTSAVAVERIRQQARLQVAGGAANRTIYELIPQIEAERGLAAPPEPSPGDLFFDIDGDPFALDPGLRQFEAWLELDAGREVPRPQPRRGDRSEEAEARDARVENPPNLCAQPGRHGL